MTELGARVERIVEADALETLDTTVRAAIAAAVPERVSGVLESCAISVPIGLGLPRASRYGATATRVSDDEWDLSGALAPLPIQGSPRAQLYLVDSDEAGPRLAVRVAGTSEGAASRASNEDVLVLDVGEAAQLLEQLQGVVAAALLAANKAMFRDIADRARIRHQARAGRWDGQLLLHRVADLNTQLEIAELHLARAVRQSGATRRKFLLLSLLSSLTGGRTSTELGRDLALEDHGIAGIDALGQWPDKFVAYRDTLGAEFSLKLALAEVGLPLAAASRAAASGRREVGTS